MRLAVDRVAAPATVIGTAAGGDQGQRSTAMMLAPGAHVPADINAIAVGPRLRVEIADERRVVGTDDGSIRGTEDERGQIVGRSTAQTAALQQRGQSELT